MKKVIILLSLTCFLVTGCSVRKLNTNDIDKILDNILVSNKKLKHEVFNGYSYYCPKGLKFLEKADYNAMLSDQYNNKYYLYVDVVSYYHEVSNSYKEDKSAYYSKKIEGKKNGYLEINEVEGSYFIEAVYNYSKMEILCEKDNLSDVIVNVFSLLSSVKYNDKVLETTIGENVLNYEEESFNIFTTTKSDSNYLDYVEKYDNIDGSNNKIEDEDSFDIDLESD